MRAVLPLTTAVLLLLQNNVKAQDTTDWVARIQNYADEFGGRVGLAAKSITTGKAIAVNADTLFPTASVIKLPVLVELFYQFKEGKLTPGKPIPLADRARVGGDGILR